MITELRGGKFKSGFVGAFIAKLSPASSWVQQGLFNLPIRTVAAVVFGGLAARATGGSFSDGAMAAAFAHLFNAEAAHPGTFGGAAPRPIDWGGIGRFFSTLGTRALGALGFLAPTEMGDSSLIPIMEMSSGSSTYRQRALDAAGISAAQASNYQIHHVVAQTAAPAFIARGNLAAVGIGVHDLENLLVMPTTMHRGVHTPAYYGAVNAATSIAVPGGYNQMVSTLDSIKASLISRGTYP